MEAASPITPPTPGPSPERLHEAPGLRAMSLIRRLLAGVFERSCEPKATASAALAKQSTLPARPARRADKPATNFEAEAEAEADAKAEAHTETETDLGDAPDDEHDESLPADGLNDSSSAAAVDRRPAAASESSLVRYSRAVRAIAPLDAAEEVQLVAAAQAGDAAARQRLIECHLGVVIAVARSYARVNMLVEDLIEEGNLGLMEAVDRFDRTRGVRFASYARWWIREAINNAITTQSRAVRLPSHIVRGISSVMKAQRALDGNAAGRPGRPGASASTRTQPSTPASIPTPAPAPVRSGPARTGLANLADITGRTPESVAQLLVLSQPALSLNTNVEGADESALQDGLLAATEREPDAALLSKELLSTVLSLVDRLPKVERSVVIQRFGFGFGEPRTLEEVGTSVGLTAERVRQLQVQALGRMREMLASRGIDASQFL